VGRYALSTRRACGVIKVTRSSAYYRSRKDPLLALRQRMREVAQTRVRFGYRRLRVVMLREGWEVGKERFYRVYIEEGTGVTAQVTMAACERGASRAAPPSNRSQRHLEYGLRIARTGRWPPVSRPDGTVIDLFTRECLAIDAGQSLSGHDVATTLERLRFERGLPERIYCDNGSEFVSAVMDRWLYTNQVILDFSRRRKPSDNATIESFSGRFREECLNVHWFASLGDARQTIDAFRCDYNEKSSSPCSQGAKSQGITAASDADGRRVTIAVVRKSRSSQSAAFFNNNWSEESR
jgi:putative transposase